MTTPITTPDIPFTGFYYPQLLADMLRWKRLNMPNLKSEHAYDPDVQQIRAWALMGHYCSVRLDAVAQEAVFGTLRTRQALIEHSKLDDYRIKGDVPATTTLIYRLAQTIAPLTEVVPDNSLAATRAIGTQAAVIYETDNSVSVQNTDKIDSCMIFDDGLASYTDITASVNTAALPVALLPAVPAVGDMLYIGHQSVIWDRIDIGSLTVAMADVDGRWEVYDGDWKDMNPDLVTDLGPNLTFNVNSLLGTTDATGAIVRVYFNATDAYEDCVSTWTGTINQITTAAGLGQPGPLSTVVTDYTIGTQWRPLALTEDTAANLTADGNLKYTLPKNQTINWIIGDVSTLEDY